MTTHFCTAALTLAMVNVIVLDATQYRIPNWLNGSIALLFIAAVFLLPIHAPLGSLAAAGIVFFVCSGLFGLGLMGGGDIKLLTVLTLWTGWNIVTPTFLLLTALFGGVLVVAILLLRKLLPPFWRSVARQKALPRFFTPGQPIPYGLAIATAFYYLLATHQVATLAHG